MVSNFFLLTSVALFDAFSVQPRGYKRRWLLLPLSPRCWDQTAFTFSPQSSSWQGFAIARQCQEDPPQWQSLWRPSTLLEHLMSMFGLGRRSRFDGDTSSLLIWLRCDFFFFFFFFCHRCLTSILFIWLISISLDKCCFHLIGSDAWEPWIAATPCREELPPSAPGNQSQDVSVFSTTHIFQYHTSPYWFKLIDTTSRPCHTGLRIYRFMSTALVVSIIFVAPNFSTVLHNSVHISTLLHTVLHFSTNFHTVSIPSAPSSPSWSSLPSGRSKAEKKRREGMKDLPKWDLGGEEVDTAAEKLSDGWQFRRHCHPSKCRWMAI